MMRIAMAINSYKEQDTLKKSVRTNPDILLFFNFKTLMYEGETKKDHIK